MAEKDSFLMSIKRLRVYPGEQAQRQRESVPGREAYIPDTGKYMVLLKNKNLCNYFTVFFKQYGADYANLVF